MTLHNISESYTEACATYITDSGAEYKMLYRIDHDEHGPYPYMLRFRYEGFPWEPSMVPQRVQDSLIAAAYEQIRGPSE